MSGIAGVRSDAPAAVKRAQLAALFAAGGRAVSVSREWREAAGIGLGGAHSGRVVASERFLIAADARLDGRRELAAQLERDAATTGDAALILAAWERWGRRAPDHFIGDFAIAVWDLATRSLVLLRDALGMRPLFFTPTAFASHGASFQALDPRHGRPSATTLRAYLAWRDPGDASFFEGVERVASGEMVTFKGARAIRERWWRPSTIPVRRRPDDLIAECRALLDQAVADRVGDAGPVLAAHLSAGLDSGTAVALAAGLKPRETELLALTAVPSVAVANPAGRLIDERPMAARAAATLPGVRHRAVPAAGDPVGAFVAGALIYQQPLPNPYNHLWGSAINDEAVRAGARVLLIGQTGNYSFSMSGDPYRRFKALAKRLLRRGGPGYTPSPFVRANEPGPSSDAPPAGGAERRLHFLHHLDPGPYLAGVEGHWSLSIRDPFADRRFVEFSLRIPEATLASLGNRGMARAVAAQLLPPDFAADRRRGYQAADWIERLRHHCQGLLDLVTAGRAHPMLGELLDLSACEDAIVRLKHLASPGSAEERLYRTDLPTALAVIGFVMSRAGKHPFEPRMAQANALS